MAKPEAVEIKRRPIEMYREVLEGDFERLKAAAAHARVAFEGRTIWHVNSTAKGGGVAEILQGYLPFVSDAGVDIRWLVLKERAEFFGLTKRIHNLLHGYPGDGVGLGPDEVKLYEDVASDSASYLLEMIKPRDVVFLHDPQTAGLVPLIKQGGATVIWRCHIGADRSNSQVDTAIGFLSPYVEWADSCVFSRSSYVWTGLPEQKTQVISPAIDPFSPKNQVLDEKTVDGILKTIGISAGVATVPPEFARSDGTRGLVERSAEIHQSGPVPDDAPLIVQVSRWDLLKDHGGLMTAFGLMPEDGAAHLALVGPASGAVSDDPEGEAVFAELLEHRQRLDERVRDRIHIVNLPMDELEENAVMVNALQRRADILVQKSLAEGFGLTVAEGMWKGRPVVASAVGGINDQIVNGESGILIDDPSDFPAFAKAFETLLSDPQLSERIGRAATERITAQFLSLPRLSDYSDLIARIEGGAIASP